MSGRYGSRESDLPWEEMGREPEACCLLAYLTMGICSLYLFNVFSPHDWGGIKTVQPLK